MVIALRVQVIVALVLGFHGIVVIVLGVHGSVTLVLILVFKFSPCINCKMFFFG